MYFCFAAVFLGTACLLPRGKKSATGNAGEVYVYNWGEYIDEAVITMFEEETGIKVVYDMFETNEEMYPVIEAGGVNYDVICPSDYMIQKMIENDLLAELNFDNIPNISEIDPNSWSVPKPSTRKISNLLLIPGELWASSITPAW